MEDSVKERAYMLEKVTNGGIGDLSVLDGDVEVDTYQDTLVLEVDVSDGEFV